MRLLVLLRAARRLAAMGVLVVALTASLPGTGILGASSASASTETTSTLHASEASDCAGRATGPVSDNFKLAVCTDLDSDLVGIAKLLGLPAIAPATTSLTSPVEVEFSDAPDENSASAYMETRYFSAGSPYIIEPCRVIIYPLGYADEDQSATSVSA